MAAKVTMVSLVCLATEQETEFEVDHAERILNIRESGWGLPEGSDYEFRDGNISRRDKKAGGGAKKA